MRIESNKLPCCTDPSSPARMGLQLKKPFSPSSIDGNYYCFAKLWQLVISFFSRVWNWFTTWYNQTKEKSSTVSENDFEHILKTYGESIIQIQFEKLKELQGTLYNIQFLEIDEEEEVFYDSKVSSLEEWKQQQEVDLIAQSDNPYLAKDYSKKRALFIKSIWLIKVKENLFRGHLFTFTYYKECKCSYQSFGLMNTPLGLMITKNNGGEDLEILMQNIAHNPNLQQFLNIL